MAVREEIVLGIDLGTSNTCVAIFRNGNFEAISDGDGEKITPSCVAFNDDGRAFGRSAKDNRFANPRNTLLSLKRIIGKRFNEPEVSENAARWPFRVVNFEGLAAVEVTENDVVKILRPEDVAAMLLRHMKEIAETYLSRKVTKAVITVPANFTDSQRRATILAGTMADLDVLRIINEPTAAAIAYGLHRTATETLMVVDFGGGTLDVSILKISGGQSFEVLATSGDMRLGGDDFDERILQRLQTQFETTNKVSLKNHVEALAKLRQEAEMAKLALSGGRNPYRVAIPFLDGKHNFHTGLSLAEFEQICEDLLPRISVPVRDALNQVNLTTDDITQIVMVGGSSKLPWVERILRNIFPGQTIHRDINPDEAIACGAAVYGNAILGANKHKMTVIEVIPRSLGVEVLGGWMATVVQKNTQFPCRKSRIFSTASSYDTSVDISVYEGEARQVQDNRLLDEMRLTGIVVGEAGEPRIEVTFEYDLDGILKVTALDLDTNAVANVTIPARKMGGPQTGPAPFGTQPVRLGS